MVRIISWFKKMKFVNKITFILCGGLLLVGIPASVIISTGIYNYSEKQTESYASATANYYSADYATDFEKVSAALQDFRSSIKNIRNNTLLTREQVVDMIKQRLGENSKVLALYTLWELNAFDGKDSDYIGKPYHDSTGRFIPYVTRLSDGGFSVEALTDYEIVGAGDYYLLPKTTKKTVLTEPYYYKVQGKDVLIASITMPIFDDNNNVLGIVGADIELSTFQSKIEKIKPMNGYATLISNTGLYVADGLNKDNIMKNVADINPQWRDKWKNILDKIEKSQGLTTNDKLTDTKENSLYVFVPMTLEGTDVHWTLEIAVPKQEIFADYYKTLTILIITVLALALVLVFAILLTRKLLKPLSNIASATKEAALGDLTVKVECKSEDEIGVLANNFNTMIEKQREAMMNILNSSEIVSSSSEEISSTTEELTSTAQSQSQSVEQFTTTLNQMDESIQDVTSNMSKLALNVSNVTSAITEMGNSVQDTAKNVQGASLSVNQVAVSMEQMGQSVKTIAKHSKEAQEEANVTVTKAQEGNKTVNNTIKEMEEISQSVVELAGSVKELGSSAEKIGEIVDVIDDIAEQTNLLSLNAAIEAARAGDAGKGFAVVANAIRNLAERSGEATKDIARLIKEVQGKVGNAVAITNKSTEKVKYGVENVKNTGVAFEEIYNAINKTSLLIKEIAVAIQQQETGSNEIIKAVEKMNDIVNHLSATTEEQAAGSDEIVKSVEKINDITQQVSATTQEQAASSQEIVKLVQGINRGIGEISIGSEEISSTTTHLAGQAQDLLGWVSKFKVK